MDRRWASPGDDEPSPVIVIDNVPSQANRLELALWRDRESSSIPEFILDFSSIRDLPAHLPRSLSSLQFPHRNADAYLRDSVMDDKPFMRTEIGKAIFDATAQECGPLISWFPQALLYGFWQSHLGKKRSNTKHARAWVSEIIGWKPASHDTKVMGLKGDPLNLSIREKVTSNADDQTTWTMGGKQELSAIGHGQVPFMGDAAAAAAVSFARISQRATISFAQLRRVGLGSNASREADAATRALLVTLGLHAHQLAFGRAFALRSGADLRRAETTVKWLGGSVDEACDIGGTGETRDLLATALDHARSAGVPLDGWGQPPTILLPGTALADAIRSTWPELGD